LKKTQYLFLAVGLFILVMMFYSFGIKKPIEDIVAVGWGFSLILGIHIITHLSMTYSWWILTSVKIKAKYFANFFLARVAADSTTMISSIAGIAGDPLRAMYVRNIVPFKTGFASVLLDRISHGLGNIVIILIGIMIAFFKLNVPIYALIGLFALFVFLFGFIIQILKKQNEGILQHLISNLPDQLRDKLMNGPKKEKILMLDEEIKYCFSSKENLNHFIIAVFLHSIPLVIINALEIYMILLFIGQPITLVDASLVYLFGLLSNMLIFFIPMNIGSSEGAYSISLSLLGHDPVLGLSVGLIRRLRQIVWMLLGLILLFKEGLTKDKALEMKSNMENNQL